MQPPFIIMPKATFPTGVGSSSAAERQNDGCNPRLPVSHQVELLTAGDEPFDGLESASDAFFQQAGPALEEIRA